MISLAKCIRTMTITLGLGLLLSALLSCSRSSPLTLSDTQDHNLEHPTVYDPEPSPITPPPPHYEPEPSPSITPPISEPNPSPSVTPPILPTPTPTPSPTSTPVDSSTPIPTASPTASLVIVGAPVKKGGQITVKLESHGVSSCSLIDSTGKLYSKALNATFNIVINAKTLFRFTCKNTEGFSISSPPVDYLTVDLVPAADLSFKLVSPENFNDVLLGKTNLSCLEITNTGQKVATGLSGSINVPFKLAIGETSCAPNYCGDRLAPGEVCTMPITFTPRFEDSAIVKQRFSVDFHNGIEKASGGIDITGNWIATLCDGVNAAIKGACVVGMYYVDARTTSVFTSNALGACQEAGYTDVFSMASKPVVPVCGDSLGLANWDSHAFHWSIGEYGGLCNTNVTVISRVTCTK